MGPVALARVIVIAWCRIHQMKKWRKLAADWESVGLQDRFVAGKVVARPDLTR
jgi:hypothetical protein